MKSSIIEGINSIDNLSEFKEIVLAVKKKHESLIAQKRKMVKEAIKVGSEVTVTTADAKTRTGVVLGLHTKKAIVEYSCGSTYATPYSLIELGT